MSKVYETVAIPSYPRGQGNCSRCGHAETEEGAGHFSDGCRHYRVDGNICRCPEFTAGNWKTRYDKTPIAARRGS